MCLSTRPPLALSEDNVDALSSLIFSGICNVYSILDSILEENRNIFYYCACVQRISCECSEFLESRIDIFLFFRENGHETP